MWNVTQFLSSGGQPLSGGLVYTYAGGSTTPIQTFTSSTCATPNANPIVLNAGGFAQIWASPATVLKFQIRTSGGSLVQTIDGVQVGGGGGGGGTSQWVTSGSNIYNSNSGNVGIGTTAPGYKFEVNGNSQFDGLVRISNTDTTAHSVVLSTPGGIAGDYNLSFPSALPGSTSCLQGSTAGALSWTTCGGGGGGTGGPNPYATSAGAVTSLAIDVTALNLTSINPALVQCWTGTSTRSPVAITNFTTTGTSPITTVTPTFGSTSNMTCQVNATGSGSTIWSQDSDKNITLSDSLTAVSALKFMNQTASTGNTAIIVQAGAAQTSSFTPLISFRNNAGTEFSGVDFQGAFFTQQQLISQDGSGVGSSVNGGISAGISLSNSKAIQWSSDATWFGTPDLGVNRNAAGVMEINSGTPGDYRDLHIRNLTIDGTCTGSACLGGGGGGAPFSDSVSLVKNNADNTKQMRFSLTSVPTSTTGVLTVKAAATYVLPGENIANTWGTDQTFAGYILASAAGKNIGSTTVPFADEFSKRAFSEEFKISAPGTSFAASFSLAATSNVMTLRNQSNIAVTTWSCPGAVCQTTFGATNVEVDGTSSGILLPLIITDTNNSPGLNLYASSTREATWSAGATVAFDVRNQADLHRFLIFQNGDTQIGTSTSDQGYALYVAGNIFATGNITCGGTCGGGGGANITLSNLSAATAVNQNLKPATNGIQSLGTLSSHWGSVWTTALSSNLGAAMEIGPTDNQPLEFFTNNTERARFLGGGQLLLNRTSDDGTTGLLQISRTGQIAESIVGQLYVSDSVSGSLGFFNNTNAFFGYGLQGNTAAASGAGIELINSGTAATRAINILTTSGGGTAAGIHYGAGSPNSVVTDNPGSIYLDSGGHLYLKTSGTGSSGWTLIL